MPIDLNERRHHHDAPRLKSHFACLLLFVTVGVPSVTVV